MTESLGFTCIHCSKRVEDAITVGTAHRNHCTFCLWSKHVDKAVSGDRAAECGGAMEPVGVTLKQEGLDKYGKQKLGDVMLVHHCTKCGQININRIAADDSSELIVEIFEKSASLPEEVKEKIKTAGVVLLEEKEKPLLEERLFGKSF